MRWVVATWLVLLQSTGCDDRREKAQEARTHVERLTAMARAYYEEQGQLPPEVGATPALGACCREGGGVCQPNEQRWAHPTWRALGFGMSEPHRYSYALEQLDEPAGVLAARAYGDLDCDGVYSTFEMYVNAP